MEECYTIWTAAKRILSNVPKALDLRNLDLIFLKFVREVRKADRDRLMEKALAIYAKYDFEVLTVSKRIENKPPSGFDRGHSCILILRSLFGVDWEERVKVRINRVFIQSKRKLF